MHHRNIQIRATETYEFLQGLSPPLMNEVFVERNSNYSLRGNIVLTRRRVNSVRYCTETVSFLAPKIWDILPKDIKDSESLDIFNRKIKKWIPSECSCRLCKTYVARFYLGSENQRYISFTKLTSISFPIIVKMLV